MGKKIRPKFDKFWKIKINPNHQGFMITFSRNLTIKKDSGFFLILCVICSQIWLNYFLDYSHFACTKNMRFENKRGSKWKKKWKKKHGLQFEKTYFLYCSFITGPILDLSCISKMICKSLRRHSYNILNHSKMEKNWERFAKVFRS